MTLSETISYVREMLGRMNEVYGDTFFDEFAIMEFHAENREQRQAATFQIYHYEGPREERFHEDFVTDSAGIRNALTMHGDAWRKSGGQFNFTNHGAGEKFDVAMCLRPRIFLFCNNTKKSLAELRESPNWSAPVEVFLEISAEFTATPLQIQLPKSNLVSGTMPASWEE